jgi:hypothetical protein
VIFLGKSLQTRPASNELPVSVLPCSSTRRLLSCVGRFPPGAAHLTAIFLGKSLQNMVGLGRIELPTSPLSGVRSSQLSYRPVIQRPGVRGRTPARNLALLATDLWPLAPAVSVSTWWSWSGSNRRPPECKSGALPAELQPRDFRGQTRQGSDARFLLTPAPCPLTPIFLIEADWTHGLTRQARSPHRRSRITLIKRSEVLA